MDLAGFLGPNSEGQDSEGEEGRKVGERDRVEVFCDTCGNM